MQTWRIALTLLAATVVSLVIAVPPAWAGQTRPYSGVTFGRDGASGTEPFREVTSITIDQSSGDIYVYDKLEAAIYKFDSAGEPAIFFSTGTNSFAVEPALAGPGQIAVAPPGSSGGTEGDIYLASAEGGNRSTLAATVYAPSGARLGAFGPEGRKPCGVAVDAAGHVILAGEQLLEYAPSTNPPTDSDFVQAFAPEGEFRELGNLCPVALANSGTLYAVELSGENNPAYRIEGVSDTTPTRLNFVANAFAVNPATGVIFADKGDEVEEYAANGTTRLGVFGATQIHAANEMAINSASDSVYVVDESTHEVKVFGKPIQVPTVTVGQVLFPIPTEAVVNGTVEPEGAALTGCFVEYGTTKDEYEHTVPCASIPSGTSGAQPVEARLTGLEPEGNTYHFRLAVTDTAGTARTPDQTVTTPLTVQTLTPEVLTETQATAIGRLFPNGKAYTACDFEYEELSESASPSTVECSPKAGEIASDQQFHRVTGNLTGLQPNHVGYRVRLVATTAQGTVNGEWVRFFTSGEPLISEVRSTDADQHSAELEATIDPGGFRTSYRIEWGPTASYGHIADVGSVEPMQGLTRVSARLEALAAGTAYHYRVVAANESAESKSLDREVETLDSCGLPQARCFELVSEREPGPVASPGHGITGLVEAESLAQAAERQGALGYVSESGYPGATRGGELFYRAIRGPSGWSSSQLSPPITVRDETVSAASGSSRTLALSPELSCGVIETNQPLSGTTARMREVLEAGGENLYRLNGDDTYTPITTLPPESLTFTPNEYAYFAGNNKRFLFAGMSTNCERVYFESIYRYPGTGIAGEQNGAGEPTDRPLYEWREGNLKAVGSVPAPGGELTAVPATPGNDIGEGRRADRNAVSSDGRRIFFTAKRASGTDPAEVGQPGLFVREDGATIRDVSASETETADTDPRYQWATPDGSEVFFTAPAGLTSESSSEGTDLYVYDLRKSVADHPLIDLSVNKLGGEAAVAGMVGASEDGALVYFAATARLVAGEGLTTQENREAEAYSLYLSDGGHLRFVATVSQPKGREALFLSSSSTITSQVSADGRYLAFESVPPGTGGPSAALPEVYLFDADASREALSCVSCMPGERIPTRGPFFQQLAGPNATSGERALPPPRALVVTAGKPSVIFSSRDALTPEAAEGETNLFEWAHNQVFLINAEAPGLRNPHSQEQEYKARTVFALGSDADGSDLYFSTAGALTWEDSDGRSSVYDARSGGGFPKPPAQPGPCNPTIEGSCQGSAAAAPSLPAPRSSDFVGPPNPKPKCTKRRVRKHGKCVKRPSRHRGKHRKSRKRSHSRGAKSNRRVQK